MQISQSQIPGILSSIISVPITSKWICQESERNWDLFCPSSVSLLVTALSGHREVPTSPISLKINNAEVWNQENSYSCKLKVVCSNFPGVTINLSMVIMMFVGRWSVTVDKKSHHFINMYFVNPIYKKYMYINLLSLWEGSLWYLCSFNPLATYTNMCTLVYMTSFSSASNDNRIRHWKKCQIV